MIRNGKMAMIIICLSVCQFCSGIETDPNKYRIIRKSVLGYDINYYDPNDPKDIVAASKSHFYWYAPDKEWWYNPNGSEYVLTEDGIKTVAEAKWISEHTPNEDRGWHLSEKGFLTGNIWFWLICLSGCIVYLVDIKWFIVFALMLAVVEAHLCAGFVIYGGGVAWLLVILVKLFGK